MRKGGFVYAVSIHAPARGATAEAGLKSPLTIEEFERVNPIASIAEIAEIPGMVSREVGRRKKIEDAAAAPTFGPPPVGANPAPTTPAPPPHSSTPPPAGPPPTGPTVKLWDVTLKFRCTAAQAGMLKPMFAAQGIEYTVVSQTEVR